jgi:predicted RNase H-like nuclease (RuvC/YqgF family)
MANQDPNNANNPAQKSSGSSFTLFKQKEKNEPDPEIIQLHHDFNSLSRRIREQEDRLQNLRKKSLMIDSTILSQNKKYKQELKLLTSEIDSLKHMMDNLDNKMLLLIKELRMAARKDDVKVLQRYINIWEPINFVTRNEVEKITKDITEDMINDFIRKYLMKKKEK